MTTPIRAALRAAVTDAMRRRDRDAVAVYRTALSALDNAGAVPARATAGAVEASPVGVGAAETARRELTEPEQVAVVRAEAEELRTVAAGLPAGDAAKRMLQDATLLDALLDGPGPG